MNSLIEAIARISLEVHPQRIEAICSALGSENEHDIIWIVRNCLGDLFSTRLTDRLGRALQEHPQTTAAEVCAMFRASAETAALAASASTVELVWTGPGTGLVPTRHTEQVLTGLIDQARDRLFMVSFVAFHVESVMRALARAAERKVVIRVLVERSKEHGGNVAIDSIPMLKQTLPQALLYEWSKECGDPSASVHAKCAVADDEMAFVTSANLTEAAMERNMELGILIRGGRLPRLLDQHLTALVTTRQLRAL